MLQTILPETVTTVVADGVMWLNPLSEEEEKLIATAVSKRQREFRAGRNAARQALALRGQPQPNAILKSASGAPQWPTGIVGSITHTQDYCAVALADRAQHISIGIDVEQNVELQDDILTMVCTPAEREWVYKQRQENAVPWAKLCFSCKEAVYKAFNPLYDRFLEFHDVDLTFEVASKTFVAAVKGKAPVLLYGRFQVDSDYVYSSVVVE